MAQQWSDFEVRVESRESATVVTATGEVDIATAPHLRETLEHTLTTTPPVLILDFSGVTYFDSTGLDVLVHLRNITEDGQLHLVVSRAVRRPLLITGLDRLIPTHDDLASALTADSSRPR